MTSDHSWQTHNGLVLAYIGDGVYELFVRMYVLNKGMTQPKKLHKASTNYVSAKAQCFAMQAMLEQEGFLTPEEDLYYRRGRNSKSHTSAKNADILTYRIATGFEALIGYLYLSKQEERLEEIMTWSIKHIEGSLV